MASIPATTCVATHKLLDVALDIALEPTLLCVEQDRHDDGSDTNSNGEQGHDRVEPDPVHARQLGRSTVPGLLLPLHRAPFALGHGK